MLGVVLSLNAAVVQVSPGSSIQTAINSARSGDTIQVAAGTYAENLTIDSKRVVLLGGYAAGFGSRDIAVNVTTIQGGASSPVVQLQGEGSSGSVIDGFTIRGGRQGVVFPSWPPLRNVTVSNNTIRNNGTTSVEGGGIALSGAGNVVAHNVFYGNIASKGAAIAGGDSCLIQYNLVDSNMGHADHGGGIYLHGHPALSHNIIRRNRTGVTAGYGWGGGGIIFGNYTSARSARGSMSYDIIYGNSAPSHGGGFFVDDGAMVTMDHELFFSNSADDGGGLYVDGGAVAGAAPLLRRVPRGLEVRRVRSDGVCRTASRRRLRGQQSCDPGEVSRAGWTTGASLYDRCPAWNITDIPDGHLDHRLLLPPSAGRYTMDAGGSA